MIIYTKRPNKALKCTPDSCVLPLFFLTARLVEEKSAREGLVQVYHNNTWGWVCADQWDKHDADVACRMMDSDGALSAFLYREKRRTRKSRVWLKNLRCTGKESSLFECSHEGLGSHNCEGERRAGVLCRSKGLKGTRQLKMLNIIYFYLSRNVLLGIYNVLPIFGYGCTVWGECRMRYCWSVFRIKQCVSLLVSLCEPALFSLQ